ncbi:DUF3108 domain-containing protein [Scleromatobacter humisilvae]|uniref:DUF3108 domain-containing protein n=1 Tax=Scleromatobacter humisilvae TaxID=2897159 RepID=A0A9X1YL90_9BURK|nr:DUF3108 domain-containing protein [Scleromatobacter humisilvae]MCK9688379.1 DUF3108 domain-containing protein [Scleromatobacter humisilvae]
MRSPWRESRRRRAAWFALIVAVLLVHALFGLRVLSGVIGWNTSKRPKAIEVTFSKRVQPTAPPPATAPAPTPPAPRPRASRVARASSAPVPASAPEPAQPPASAVATASTEALPDAAGSAEPDMLQRAQMQRAAIQDAMRRAAQAAAAAASASEAASAAAVAGPGRPPFDWPPATRLTYTLTGERGEGVHIYGKSTVEWRREGSRYEVDFNVHISPLIDQHMYSNGTLGPDGLSPQHYDESFSFLFATPRTRHIEFGDSDVTLNNGNRVIKLPQTQDGASQFVQFVWMFYNHPEWLTPGHVVQIPLALPNNLRRWHYQVLGTEHLDLAFGAIDAVHLKPLLDGPRRPNEYPFDIWTAPSLQYLPVQILVKVDDHTWALLALDDLPMQAAGERPAPPPPKVQAFPPPPPVGER